MKFEFNPDEKKGYGHWSCPSCGSKFHGGGEAIHKSECLETSYDNCTYHFGSKEAATCRKLGQSPLGPLTIEVLNEQFPHLR